MTGNRAEKRSKIRVQGVVKMVEEGWRKSEKEVEKGWKRRGIGMD